MKSGKFSSLGRASSVGIVNNGKEVDSSQGLDGPLVLNMGNQSWEVIVELWVESCDV